MPASAAPNSRRTGSRSLCSLQISLTLLRGHTLENIWRGRPCCVCGHFEPKKSAKLELGRLLHDIFSFLRFLQASNPRRTPPAIQAALTDLTKLFHSADLPGDSRVTLVRPQWEYNATYRALTW